MAKKEYFKLIYLRQEDRDGDYWYAVPSNSRHASVAAITSRSIRGIKHKLLTFSSVKSAQAMIDSGSLPDMGGVWEIVNKWVPKPVSSAQRNLGSQYCQKKRQLAGIRAMAVHFFASQPFSTALNSYYIDKEFRGVERKLDSWYAAALKEMKEKKND